MMKINENGVIRDMTEQEIADLNLPVAQRSQWEEAARKRAAKALRPNFEAVGMMLNKRGFTGADVAPLTAFLAAIEPITQMDLAAATDEQTAYALMLTQYNIVRAAVPAPLRAEFSGIVANIIKRAL
jgi:hypothetical protein